MKIVSIIIVVIFAILMFRLKREHKMALLILSTLVFSVVHVPGIPLSRANDLLPFCFLLSEIIHIKRHLQTLKHSIVWRLLKLTLIMFVLTVIFSPHLHDLNSFRMYFQSELLFKYFALAYAFIGFSDEKSLKITLRMSVIGLIALTIFGIINTLTHESIFVRELMKGSEYFSEAIQGTVDNYSSSALRGNRMRVQSMFINPFDYGYICSLMLMLHVYGYSKKMESRSLFLISIVCSLFGIFACGCRTVILCAILGISLYILLAFKIRKIASISICSVFVLVLAYINIPILQEKIDQTVFMFDKNNQTGGSSVEMRAMQMAAVIYHVDGHYLFGQGYKYFQIDLGWSEGWDGLKDERLMGLESVVFQKILEHGFIGLALFLYYYCILLRFFISKRSINIKESSAGISLITIYLLFAIMTGELSSTYPTLLLLGYFAKNHYKPCTI